MEIPTLEELANDRSNDPFGDGGYIRDNKIDKWKDKTTFVCSTCMYWVGPVTNHSIAGRCRRHAPVVQQGWPLVYSDDWCGDHKLRKG